MQETKRRTKRGMMLLALVVALAVMALVPASALAASPTQLVPVLDFSAGGAVQAQGNHWWFNGNSGAINQYGTADGEYTFWTVSPSNILLTDVGTTNIKTVVFKVDGSPTNGVPNAVTSSPYPVDLNNWGILGSKYYTEGLHTVSSWVVETSPTVLYEKPIVSDVFGVDTKCPTWVHYDPLLDGSSYSAGEVFWNLDKVDFTATTHDPDGSGVAPTPTAQVIEDSSTFEGYRLAWDQYIWEVTGTVMSPTSGIDPALAFTPVTKQVLLTSTDWVKNSCPIYKHVNFDRVAPHTSYTITPAGSDTQLGWTNQDVTVKFSSVDGLPQPNSGVDYTEYVVKTSTTTAVPPAPGINESGTQGDEVTITETAPIGPVYVYYRSVDKAMPTPNREAWNLVMVYIDKVAPELTNDYPGWWMNTDFVVGVTGSDHNSGIAAPGIEYKVNPLIAPHPTEWTAGDYRYFPVLFGALTDGIRTLSYRATDKAGNYAEGSVDVKIDTRAPVTDGASGWINGLEPYVMTATDQVPGAGVAATVYRVDQATPWSVKLHSPVDSVVETSVQIPGDHGSYHTVDFASVDNARPAYWVEALGVHLGNWEINMPPVMIFLDNERESVSLGSFTAYKSRTVRLDKVAPAVTLTTPVNTNWQQGPAVLNFAGTDEGSGYAYTEWSTDGGATWKSGETASIGGDGEITVSYRGVDNVGIKSAIQTTTVKVATTAPTVKAKSATVKKGKKATIKFNVTAVTDRASVNILIRKNGVTKMLKRYSNVGTNKWASRSFRVNLPKGKYLIRVDAVDQAGNVQSARGQGTLTVK